jgi:hypothetical protein
LDALRRGRTGFPIVDAGMRELWTTGWMHNRVRMIVASFLAKDLLIDWRVGERWFRDMLADADPANNPMGWQRVAAQDLMLVTSVGGRREPLADRAVFRRLVANPLMTLAVARIHWQALQLWRKRAKFHHKSPPPAQLVSR